MRCCLCESSIINGVFCHEFGCENKSKSYDPENGWVEVYECSECGNISNEQECCQS